MPGPHRTVAKHSYLTGKDQGFGKARAHVNYIQFRAGKDQEKEERTFFNALRDDIYNKEIKNAIADQNPKGTVMHKLILSPGVPGADVQEYTREVMADLCSKKGQDFEWYAVKHDNTDNAHCHIVIMGRDENGRTVRIEKKDYEVIKEAGDRYLERNRLLDREEKDKERDDKDKDRDEKGTVNKFFEALKAAAKEFSRAMGKDEKEIQKDETEYQRRKREKEEERNTERSLLGDDLDLYAKLLLQQKSEERQQAEKEKAWKEYCKPVELQYPLPDGSVHSFAYDRANSLESLKELAKDYAENKDVAKDSLSQDDYKRVQGWIGEKEKEIARVEEKAERLPEIDIALDSETRETWNKDSSLEDLRRLEHLSNSREVYLDKVEQKALENWINAIELKEPIRIELEKSDEPLLYERDDTAEVLAVLLNEYENGKQENLSQKDYEKLKTWIGEKDEDRNLPPAALPAERISIFEEAENQHYHYDRENELSELKGLERGFLEAGEGEYRLSQKDFKQLKVWIADKEYERDELAKDAIKQREPESERKEHNELEKPILYFEEAENQTYKYERESELSELKGLLNSHERDDIHLDEKETEKLKVWIAEKEKEELERPFECRMSDGRGSIEVRKADKIDTLRGLEQSYSEGKERPGFGQSDHEKLKVWIAEKETNEIEYGDQVYNKETELGELQQFRKDLIDSKYDQWIEKDQFKQLCSWIGSKERQQERETKDKETKEHAKEQADKESRERAKHAGKQARDERIKELKKETKKDQGVKTKQEKGKEEPQEKEIDEDAISHRGQVYSKEMPLAELQQFREDLKKSKFENWLDKEEFSKLCSWIGTKEKYGEDAFKKTYPEKYKGEKEQSRTRSGSGYGRGDKDIYVPKRKMSALEKRMQRAVRQDKSERLKAFYSEKSLKRERLEKSKEEVRTDIKWERISADKPVLQLVNMLRKGARELQKEREKTKGKEAEKLKPEEKPLEKGDKKPPKKAVLPFPEPKSHLEELANKRALDLEEKNKTKTDLEKEQALRGEKNQGKSQAKPKDKPKEKPKDENKAGKEKSDSKTDSKTQSKEQKNKDERGGW